MSGTVFVTCEGCEGEGVIYSGGYVYEHGCGHPHWDDSAYSERCPYCAGTGVWEVPTEPIEEADLFHGCA